ncbi:hypothetical protein KIW84_051559 [Lathyrus oleraceus]|uniref:Zinc finger, CCHC-type n=1 Tax=Pisum sativum TaxID=3888 RepID=A0A9D4WMY9_PEA|nr:hypothetical protein KIW84_051559 [Pisum sativum]
MAHMEIQGTKMEDLWFLDKGCSNHMSGIKKWFSNMGKTFKHCVKLGNNARMMVHGKGSIKLKMNGPVQVIKDIYYIPDLSNNLLSIEQLQERRMKVVIEDNTEDSKAYRMYNPNFKKIIINRDIVFEENRAWDWGMNDDQGTTTSNVLTWENDGDDTEVHEEDYFPKAVDTTLESSLSENSTA